MPVENVKLGVCTLTYDGVDLGLTKGGVEVEVSTDTHEVTVDQFGKTPISEYLTGRSCMVKAPLAETTLDNLIAIMPGAEAVGSPTERVDVKVGIGTNLRDIAAELIITPVGVVDGSQDFIVPLAATPGGIQFAYKLEEERIFMADFKAYPDANNVLFKFGDAAAV